MKPMSAKGLYRVVLLKVHIFGWEMVKAIDNPLILDYHHKK